MCVGVRGGDKGLGVPESGSQHFLLSPSQKEASASKVWLRVNSEGRSYRVLAMGKCWDGGASPLQSAAMCEES